MSNPIKPPLVQVGQWYMLPQANVATTTTITVSSMEETVEQKRKRAVMTNLYQVGVVFKHKRSKVLWEVLEVRKGDDGVLLYAICKSLKSQYKKAFWPDEHHYDTLILHDAPPALRILFGDEKHGKPNITAPAGNPQEVEQAFDLELSEEEILQIDPSED